MSMAVAGATARDMPDDGVAVIEGILERVTYANQESGYTIVRLAVPGQEDLVTAVGHLLGAKPGESMRLSGQWKNHAQYGRQFAAESYSTLLPASINGIQRYLGSGLIKGIGPVMAGRIVSHFGLETLAIIEQQPRRLNEVPGLGVKKAKMIAVAWEEQKMIKAVMLFLQDVGVTTGLAVRIYKTFGEESIRIVKEEPYRLASSVWGVGFKTADRIARAMGLPRDSSDRIKAGIAYTLSLASDEGHCYLPQDKLVTDTVSMFRDIDEKDATTEGIDLPPLLPSTTISSCLDALAAEGGVVREALPGAADDAPHAIYLTPLHRAESTLAQSVRFLLRAPMDALTPFKDLNWETALTWLHGQTGNKLEPAQEDAVRQALTRKVSILTGGPGMGKSFSVRSIVTLAKAKGARVILTAPTGRAAKRLEELGGTTASTIHRLLQIRPGGEAVFNKENPLTVDLLIVDEASMLDTALANTLFKAIPSGAHVLLVGDVDQLPSVGPGEVLRNLIECGIVPSVRLTKIFRQAENSGVVTNAHRINTGEMPITRGLPDFFLFVEDDNERIADLVVDVVVNRIPKKFGYDPKRDIQVLCPMRRGPAGANLINEKLQAALTPERPGIPERRLGNRVFRPGDKVVQLKNAYDKGAAGIFNGSLGIITDISPEDEQMRAWMDDAEDIAYEFSEADELGLAYALSIHKSQGSEYPVVVLPITTAAWIMLKRNLIYTGITRSKKMVVLVGSMRAISKAVNTSDTGRRYTALSQRLVVGAATPRLAS